MEGRMMEVCLVVAATLFVVCNGYPTTVPGSPEVCSKMTPGHGPSPQKSVAPYTVEVSKNEVKGGNNVQVTLSGNNGVNGQTFKGFYLQARDSSGNQVGTFAADEDQKVKTHSCGGIKNNAAHHGGKDEKEQVRVYWKAPQEYEGTVTFVASFVEDFDNFWTFVKSQPVTVSVSHPPRLKIRPSLPIPETREEGKTSKASEESRILSYNPYSPYSPLSKSEDNTPIFHASSSVTRPPQENMTSDSSFLIQSSTTTLNRRKKSSFHHLYIPRPVASPPSQEETLIVHQTDDDCDNNFKPIQKTSINFIKSYTKLPRLEAPDYTVPSYYNPEAFKTKVPRVPPVSAFAGGFQKLDPFKPLPINSPGSTAGHLPVPQFHSSYSPVKGYLHGYPVAEGHRTSNSNLKDFTPGRPTARVHFPSSNLHQHEPPFYGNYNPAGNPQAHGVLVNDYDPDVINTGIVIPKGMEHYEIPRYGYLIFNPKRGPPFYIIPAPDLDHLDGIGGAIPQPVYSRKASPFLG